MRVRNVAGVVTAALLLSLSVAAAPPPVARIQNGLVQGTTDAALSVYRGIPFAAPPVGLLRAVAALQPPLSWTGIRPAAEFAASCMQVTRGAPELGAPTLTVNEDCLYLNVWTPAKSAHEALPVMVWIYGGGFIAGSTAIPLYSGEQLAKRGVVVVKASRIVSGHWAFSRTRV